MRLEEITDKITQTIKSFLSTRANRISTVIGLIIIYLLINNRPELNSFIRWLFNDAFRKLIEQIIDNDQFVSAIAGAVAVYLIGTKKF
jgi:hypothetical protein